MEIFRMKSKYKKEKDNAWEWFSKYIRLRDCIETTGKIEYGICCTCNQTIVSKGNHAGHFTDGRRMSVLFDEKNCHLQCYRCNMHLNGNKVLYYKFMLNKYGQEIIDELLELNNQIKKYKTFELIELAETYKDRYIELKESLERNN